jgi:hypothetical protein
MPNTSPGTAAEQDTARTHYHLDEASDNVALIVGWRTPARTFSLILCWGSFLTPTYVLFFVRYFITNMFLYFYM